VWIFFGVMEAQDKRQQRTAVISLLVLGLLNHNPIARKLTKENNFEHSSSIRTAFWSE
jgi:hypothetical protein